MSADRLSLRLYRAGQVTVLQIHGALVADTLPTLQSVLDALFDDRRQPVVLDLTAVHDTDPAAATALQALAWSTRARAGIRIAAPRTAVREMLRDTGVLAAVPTFATVPAAVNGDPRDQLTDSGPHPKTAPPARSASNHHPRRYRPRPWPSPPSPVPAMTLAITSRSVSDWGVPQHHIRGSRSMASR
jgi:anti-anti-sigma regulatory factor